jgi:hypothetical protein
MNLKKNVLLIWGGSSWDDGRVAQVVEQCPFKAWVAGSNPAALTKINCIAQFSEAVSRSRSALFFFLS